MTPVNRRRFLRRALALVGMFAGAWTRSGAAQPAPTPPAADAALEDALRALLPCIDEARTVGRQLIARQPRSMSAAAARLRPWLTAAGQHRVELAQALARRREQEFARGETVIVGGWVLARCEAELCAVAALSSGR